MEITRKRFKPEEDAQLLSLHEAGKTTEEMSATLKRTPFSIEGRIKLLKDAGVTSSTALTNPYKVVRVRFGFAEVEEMKRLHAEGKTLDEIAAIITEKSSVKRTSASIKQKLKLYDFQQRAPPAPTPEPVPDEFDKATTPEPTSQLVDKPQKFDDMIKEEDL